MSSQTILKRTSWPSGNLRVAILCGGIALGMVGMAYAAVPLYQLFCQITGYGGTTQVSAGNINGIIDRVMTVRFDENVAPDLDFTIVPAKSVSSKIGTVHTVVYVATNNSDVPVSSTASFNVAPAIAGAYFNKIECFCFTEQTLQPGESVEMPVVYFLDPELDGVSELDTVQEVTLSYTFYTAQTGSS
ncbi:MAG TPA: cytochrome c oxidase assembly protein [Devosia sp.]|nr:cytochrome c oxidase assembly protein [Devosia sp.]